MEKYKQWVYDRFEAYEDRIRELEQGNHASKSVNHGSSQDEIRQLKESLRDTEYTIDRLEARITNQDNTGYSLPRTTIENQQVIFEFEN